MQNSTHPTALHIIDCFVVLLDGHGLTDTVDIIGEDEITGSIQVLPAVIEVEISLVGFQECLFGLHQTDAFPVDVWMKRVLAEQYPTGYPYEKYSPYNGIYQQYMFAYYRNGMDT